MSLVNSLAGNSVSHLVTATAFARTSDQVMPIGNQIQGPADVEYNNHNTPIAIGTEQNGIQFVTIKNQYGGYDRIPVKVQTASKNADEKRKRNASASSRFRARQKEKEREASQSMLRLVQRSSEAAEDVEYYRTERDYFKSVVLQQPGAERHYSRPTSPRLHRTSMPSPSTVGGSADSPYSDYEDDEPVEPERNVRRRNSNYHPATGPPQAYPAQYFPPVNNPPMNRPLVERGCSKSVVLQRTGADRHYAWLPAPQSWR